MSVVRRRMAYEGNKNPSYIEDGLVFWLNCEDVNLAEHTWTDRINNIVITLNNISSIDNKGGVVFGSSGSYGYSNGNVNSPRGYATIEAVLKSNSDTDGTVLSLPTNKQSFCYATSKLYNTFGNSSVKYFDATLLGLHTIALTEDFCYEDLTQVAYAGSGGFVRRSDAANILIGRRDVGGTGAPRNVLNGSLYQIRVYNRVLTEDEILYNQAIDIKKYNIPIL